MANLKRTSTLSDEVRSLAGWALVVACVMPGYVVTGIGVPPGWGGREDVREDVNPPVTPSSGEGGWKTFGGV